MPPKSQATLLKQKQAAQKADNDWKKSKSANKTGPLRGGVANAPRVKEAQSGCTDAVCAIITAVEVLPGKTKYNKLTCDVGQRDALTIVTSWEVLEGMSCMIAMVGSFVGDNEVKETKMGGVVSQGALCDGVMLGWSDASAGSAARLPKSFDFEPGDGAPADKPRRGGDDDQAEVIFELAEMKLTKEEKKAIKAKAKEDKARAERIARGEPAELKKKKVVASKKDLKVIKKKVASKRANGEEVTTDDELEANGFLPEGVSEDEDY
jgi:tRNA-binding EMAP/Myf-like protein